MNYLLMLAFIQQEIFLNGSYTNIEVIIGIIASTFNTAVATIAPLVLHKIKYNFEENYYINETYTIFWME